MSKVLHHDDENAGVGWGAGTPFKCLPKRRLTTEGLLPDAKILRERLQLEFARYLDDPDDSHLRGMILDPVMSTAGHRFLLTFGETHRLHWKQARALLLADMDEDIILHQYIEHLKTSNAHVNEECRINNSGRDGANEQVGKGPDEDFFSAVMGNNALQ